MKILVILPNWLGDAIMATPAIELLSSYLSKRKIHICRKLCFHRSY